MDREAIREILRAIVEDETASAVDDLRDDQLLQQLGLDSVDLVSLVMQVERRFAIRMSREELDALARVGDLVGLVESKLCEASSRAAA